MYLVMSLFVPLRCSLSSPQSQNTPLHLAAASGLLSCVEVRTSVQLCIAVGPGLIVVIKCEYVLKLERKHTRICVHA